jgi:hypothetical protein
MALVAVPFTEDGEDAVQGDSTFIPDDENPLPAEEDSTYESLLEAWKKQDRDGEEDEDDPNEPTGFWILTKEHLDVACIPMENDWGNDSQWYSLVRSSKSICERLAVKTVKAP